jgi:tetratricopeptide (TPR) repeat protein
MAIRWLAGSFLLALPLSVEAVEPSWQGKLIVLTRAGVQLAAPDGKNIAPKTAGVAKDLMFQVRQEDKDRLLIDSRRQEGWIARSDAIPFDQARAYFTKLIESDPKNVHARTARGAVLSSSNEPDQAIADFTSAIALDAKATLAYYHRANVAYGKGQYDRALADYNAVIEQDPEFDWAYHVRGWIYYRRMDYDKAVADYETAIKLVPTETVFYRDRGNVAFIRKKYDDALKDYSKSIEMDPKTNIPGDVVRFEKRGAATFSFPDARAGRSNRSVTVDLSASAGVSLPRSAIAGDKSVGRQRNLAEPPSDLRSHKPFLEWMLRTRAGVAGALRCFVAGTERLPRGNAQRKRCDLHGVAGVLKKVVRRFHPSIATIPAWTPPRLRQNASRPRPPGRVSM